MAPIGRTLVKALVSKSKQLSNPALPKKKRDELTKLQKDIEKSLKLVPNIVVENATEMMKVVSLKASGWNGTVSVPPHMEPEPATQKPDEQEEKPEEQEEKPDDEMSEEEKERLREEYVEIQQLAVRNGVEMEPYSEEKQTEQDRNTVGSTNYGKEDMEGSSSYGKPWWR